jgi:adenine-specific DNA-methyltransferase
VKGSQATLWTLGEKAERGRAQSGRFTELDANKLRGGYYTSAELARWLCSWAIQTAQDSVLEPSCGDGSFVLAAARRLKELGASSAAISKQVRGIEINKAEADKARARLVDIAGARAAESVERLDFFQWWGRKDSSREFDCVLGNPPFIRYQSFPEPSRTRAMDMMVSLGLTPNKLTNIWVPFVVAATASLRDGGRLALVLPAELLQVTYASQLRSFLVDRFARVNIVACNELFFENAEQEVVLLLADGALAVASDQNPCRVALTEAKTVVEITGRKPEAVLAKASPKVVRHDSEKWLKYFLSNREIEFMRALREDGQAVPLSTHASVDVGVVTGKNAFFVLSREQVEQHDVAEYATPLVGRSAQLRGAKLTSSEWESLAAAGERVFLFHVPTSVNGTLSGAGRRYVRLGERHDVNLGYKCSVRSPWYSVPSVWEPDCFFFRQIYDFPRLVVNTAQATSTDTIHRLRCKVPAERMARSIYTHLTAASAEIEGRSYGGGVLELEPTEAERLLIPAKLGAGLPITECDRLIRAGRLDEVLEENDRLILREEVGLSKGDCDMLRRIWDRMRNRRMNRRRNSGSRPAAIGGDE